MALGASKCYAAIMRAKTITDVEEWLDAQSSEGNACWEWPWSPNTKGYGTIKPKGKTMMVHRIAFGSRVSPIPGGLFVCHHCDNPPCARPSHLFLGTQKDNIADMLRKGRGHNPLMEANAAKTHCVRGHAFNLTNTHVMIAETGRIHRECRTCRRDKARAYRAEHADKVNAYQRQRHADNPERHRKYSRDCYNRKKAKATSQH